MKRFISLVLFTSFFGFLLSCNSDAETSIEGIWSADTLLVMYDDGGFAEKTLPESWAEQLTLNEDGSYTYEWQKDGRSGSGLGNWEQEDGILVLLEEGRSERLAAQISGSTLILTTAIPGGTAELSFKK